MVKMTVINECSWCVFSTNSNNNGLVVRINIFSDSSFCLLNIFLSLTENVILVTNYYAKNIYTGC